MIILTQTEKKVFDYLRNLAKEQKTDTILITLGQVSAVINLKRPDVVRTLRGLVSKGVITKEATKKGQIIGVKDIPDSQIYVKTRGKTSRFLIEKLKEKTQHKPVRPVKTVSKTVSNVMQTQTAQQIPETPPAPPTPPPTSSILSTPPAVESTVKTTDQPSIEQQAAQILSEQLIRHEVPQELPVKQVESTAGGVVDVVVIKDWVTGLDFETPVELYNLSFEVMKYVSFFKDNHDLWYPLENIRRFVLFGFRPGNDVHRRRNNYRMMKDFVKMLKKRLKK